MRRSIAAVLLSACLIMVAAGCGVPATGKQAAARILTSAILNSVLFIESRGHRAEGAVSAASAPSPDVVASPSEKAPGEPARACRRAVPPEGDTGPSTEEAAIQSSPLRFLAESPRPIEARALEVAADGLAPSTRIFSTEASAAAGQSGLRTQIVRRLKVNRLTACQERAVTSPGSAAFAAMTPFAGDVRIVAMASPTASTPRVSIRRTVKNVPMVALRRLGKRSGPCTVGKVRIGFNGNETVVVFDADARVEEQELSTIVRNSLCIVSAAPSH
jgi:hypothetical protein